MVEVFRIKSMKVKYRVEGGMMIRLVLKCGVRLGLPLQCLYLKMIWWWVLPDEGNQLSLCRLCWKFLWCWGR